MQTEDRSNSEYVMVPRKPTEKMISAAWADALAEDAIAVWESMIEAYETSKGKSLKGSG
jgi:hypothetical protein